MPDTLDASLSFWVNASAGTGKTYQLTERAMSLLLGGCDPNKLLCLTYTRLAANQMRERIFAELAKRAEGDENATRLLIECIEAGNDFHVMTIHAFCQELLQRFPLEAGVGEGFEVADEVKAAMLQHQAFTDLLAERRRDSTLERSLELLVQNSHNFSDLRRAIIEALKYPFVIDKSAAKSAGGEERLSCALGYVARQFERQFDRQKRLHGVLTYDDLIDKAAALLEMDNGLSWVNYKLDGGIEHILVDEAQDTSPEQWRVIKALCGDFFSGEGAAEGERSIFVVGDEKQSIYGFQGADLVEYNRIRKTLGDEAGSRWREIYLTENWRSPPMILSFVDAAFADKRAAAAIGSGEVRHSATPSNRDKAAVIQIEQPLSAVVGEELRLADNIAAEVKRLVRDELAAPEEIMILLQKRAPLMDPLVFRLKKRGLKVLSDDSKPIAQHLCIMDLAAAGRFCLYPNDGYNLACLLKSPLLDGRGINEEELFRLRSDSLGKKVSLWRVVREDKAMVSQVSLLKRYLGYGKESPPFEFYMRVLGRGGENNLLANVSEAERETVNIFLSKALDFEELMPSNSSLSGFLDWLEETEQPPPKSGVAAQRGFVRVMTVHAAKGMEAPVVILADAARTSSPPKSKVLFAEAEQKLLYAPTVAHRSPEFEELLAADNRRLEEERQRLLYVALTRSKNRLIITGKRGRANKNALFSNWHQAAVTAAIRLNGERTAKDEDRHYLTAGKTESAAAEKPAARLKRLPSWAVPPPVTATQSTAESAQADPGVPPPGAMPGAMPGAPPHASPLSAETRAKDLGTFIHKLLEVLPETPPQQRLAIGENLAATHHIKAAEFKRAYAQAENLITDKRFSRIFANDSPSREFGAATEREFILKQGGKWRLGRIDRLIITPKLVTVVDFKSGGRENLPSYKEQLSFYHAAVKRKWGGERRVESGILWTDDAEFEVLIKG